jgi:hypothetical protein
MEFAAPEQFDDAKHVDLRCDVYGLAASLYLALSGKLPFGPGSQMRVLMQKLDHQFTPLAQVIEGVSPALDQTIIRSLHPDPTVRPASIREFLGDLASNEPPKTSWTPKPVSKAPAGLRQLRVKSSANADEINARKVAAARRERRGRKRHLVQIAATVRVSNPPSSDSWPSQVVNISPDGLCLQLSQRFEPNTLLDVYLSAQRTGQPAPHPVRVCWTKMQPDNNWLLGCHITDPMESESLERLLSGDLCKTTLLRKPKKAHAPSRDPKK